MTATTYFQKVGFIWELYFDGQISTTKRGNWLNHMRATYLPALVEAIK